MAEAREEKRGSFSGISKRDIIFIGLAMGMLVAAASQSIVSPALPVIVADLGGVEHYSWVATSALLTSAVVIPIVGKLADMYGRRGFYIGGLLVFLAGSALAGAAQGFWWLVAARAVQGLGMGTLIPLSQTIMGDILSARERGKYMGYLGAVFGLASIAGPLVGGWITDNFSWRWLFYVNLPIGLAALGFIVAFLKLPHTPKKSSVDYAGFSTLAVGLFSLLLATSWGGTQYPWGSAPVLGLYALGAAMLALFAFNERRAEEPVLPPGLWKNSIFTLSNIANFGVSMAMFGAIYYIPIFAQGVLGASVTNSGAVLIPLTVSMIAVSIVVGRLVTRTGRYKAFLICGPVVMALGYYLLSRLGYESTQTGLVIAMVVTGLGLGAVLQQYVLVVQNSVSHEQLGVATSTTQFFRSAGATTGIALFGTIMTGRLGQEIPAHLPEGAAASGQAQQLTGSSGVGAVLDPGAFSGMPPAVETGIREGLAASLHPVFLLGLGVVAVAAVLTLFIRELPLRREAFVNVEDES